MKSPVYISVRVHSFPLRLPRRLPRNSFFLVRVVRDAEGHSLKSGFVEFQSVDQATEALRALNGHEPEYGNKLNLSYARPRRPAPQRGGRGYSGGGY